MKRSRRIPRKDCEEDAKVAKKALRYLCVKKHNMTENELSYKIIGVAIALHKELGPGLLESAYEAALAYDLNEAGLYVNRQVPMPFVYKGVSQDIGYRLDLLVENKVIIEIKSVEHLAPVRYAQTLTYLKLADKKLGLLINFNSKVLKDDIHRIVNNL